MKHGWHPKYMTQPVTLYQVREYTNDPAINSIMEKIKSEKKTVYMVIHTYEGLIEDPVEYFEKLPLYPAWTKESKLLFTWSVKDILMEENKLVQKPLIKAEFIQSKIHPSYYMNLANSNICDCECCFDAHPCDINQSNIKPVNGRLLPLIRSPLQDSTLSKKSEEHRSKLELWDDMFIHAFTLKKYYSDEYRDTPLTLESEISESSDSSENNDEEIENLSDGNSHDVWPDS